jgi:hypothetical protein
VKAVDLISELVEQLKLSALFGLTSERAAKAIKQGEEYLARARKVSNTRGRNDADRYQLHVKTRKDGSGGQREVFH